MSKRKSILARIRTAGYHGDAAEFTRLHLMNRISYPAAVEAYTAGAKAKCGGMRCDCQDCQDCKGTPK